MLQHARSLLLVDDDGQGLVEYALILAVIAVAVIVAMVFMREQIAAIFSNIASNLGGPAPTPTPNPCAPRPPPPGCG